MDIHEELDKVIPDTWTYIAAVKDNHAKVYILSAPVDLLAPYRGQTMRQQGRQPTVCALDHYYPEYFFSGDTLGVLNGIIHQLAYFVDGPYYKTRISIKFGSVDHPFQWTEKCVHTEHCCIDHGCKYGDADCPVCLGLKPQSFQCEQCQWDDENESAFKDAERYRALRECIDPTIWGKLMSVMPFATDAFDRIIDEYKLRTKK